MNKISKPFFVLAIVLFSLSGFAQDRLTRVDSASIAWRQKDLTLSLYDKELARLLVPEHTLFGVIRIPSSHSESPLTHVPYFSPESSLTYDSISHTLVYTKVLGSIHDATRKATTIYKTVGKNRGKVVPRKRIHKYEAPRLTTRLLSITDEQLQTLKKMWTDAIQNAEDKEHSVLDGTKWVFFIGNLQAQSYEQQNALVKYVNELMDSVYNGDWDHEVVHESYKREIEWKSKDEIEQTICADTLQMKNELYSQCGDMVDYYTKSMTIGHSCLFFKFIPIGYGVPRWLIEIFKQEDGHWRLVAKGEIVIPVLSITADYDCCNNTIVFSTLNAKFDSLTGHIKSLKKMEKIGELSLADLD
ncbi:MAG: hypothetical protein IKX22_03030 [Prevotella sp.]|nr:hypothetical protein [Prevotella sp.]